MGGETEDGRVVQAGAVSRVSLAAIARADASSVAGLARLLPSAHVQTNSRGESLIYLRNAGERQVGVFLDGALLNIPWDNRIDLVGIPASILGGMRVTHGAGSVLYGANVLGGVVSLSTRSLDREGSVSEVTLSGGSGESSRLEAMHITRRGRNTVLAAVGYSRSAGMPVAGDVDLTFGQSSSALRTNTDRRLAHGFARWSRAGDRTTVGISILHVEGAMGIASEAHLNPELQRVRYWRYPSKRTTMLSASLVSNPLAGLTVRGTSWGTIFNQAIEQYSSEEYLSIAQVQDDRDLTGGFRLVAEQILRAGTLRASVSGLVSTHRERERVGEQGGLSEQAWSRYRKATWSIGSEYQTHLGPATVAVVGANLDRMSTPVTADKPPRDATNAWGATATLDTRLRNGWSIHATAGRKVRFPTMRELFGTALNRFLINDSLRPESAWLADAGLKREWDSGRLTVTAFVNRTKNTIDQLNVTVGEDRLRQRVNLSGSRVAGVELQGAIRPVGGVTVDAAATFTNPVVLGESERVVLTEKPEVLATLTVTVRPVRWSTYSVETVYTGRAFGLLPDNTLEALPRVVQINVRASLRRFVRGAVFGEAFLRINNLTDRSVIPQLGLPGPGRHLQIGLSLAV